MVVLTKIYTKTGDDGTTALGSGERVPQDRGPDESLRHGGRNECRHRRGALNAWPGSAGRCRDAGPESRTTCSTSAPISACPNAASRCCTPLKIKDAQAERLEREIDAMNGEMAPLASFVLPGGSNAGAALHLARTICRRAERHIVRLKLEGEPVSDAACLYINRLSDHLFVASRYVNGKGKDDTALATRTKRLTGGFIAAKLQQKPGGWAKRRLPPRYRIH